MNDQPTVAVSVAMKINLGNYESADAFMSVSGLTADSTAADIEELMNTGKLAWAVLTKHLGDKVQQIRARQ